MRSSIFYHIFRTISIAHSHLSLIYSMLLHIFALCYIAVKKCYITCCYRHILLCHTERVRRQPLLDSPSPGACAAHPHGGEDHGAIPGAPRRGHGLRRPVRCQGQGSDTFQLLHSMILSSDISHLPFAARASPRLCNILLPGYISVLHHSDTCHLLCNMLYCSVIQSDLYHSEVIHNSVL